MGLTPVIYHQCLAVDVEIEGAGPAACKWEAGHTTHHLLTSTRRHRFAFQSFFSSCHLTIVVYPRLRNF